MLDRNPNLPCGKGRGATSRIGQGGAQQLSVPAPAQRPPAVRVEPHHHAVAAAGPPAVRDAVLLPVLRAHHPQPDFLAAVVELDNRSHGEIKKKNGRRVDWSGKRWIFSISADERVGPLIRAGLFIRLAFLFLS